MMTSKKLLPAAVLTTLAALGLGCGGGGGTPTTEASFCMRKAEAECQVSARCVSDMAMCLSRAHDAVHAVRGHRQGQRQAHVHPR